MTSTRNKNTQSDYNLTQQSYKQSREWIDYQHSSNGSAYSIALPSLGFNPSYIPRTEFSHNSVDIESSLFGINLNNLVNPTPFVTPEFKTLPLKEFFQTLPIIMPENLIVPRNQRPYFISE